MSVGTLFTSSSLSDSGWRVAIYLAEKRLKADLKELDLAKKEQKHPDYLKVNDRGQVPGFKDQKSGAVLGESLAMLLYLERKHPTPALTPVNEVDHAVYLTRLFQYCCKLDKLALLVPVLFDKKDKHQLRERIDLLLEELAQWNKALEGKQYLANTFSIADIALIPMITGFVELMGFDLKQFPHLNAWYKKMWARESVKNTNKWVSVYKTFTYHRVLEGEYYKPASQL